MNEFQKIWVKAYEDYIEAAKATYGSLTPAKVMQAKEHADAVLTSLSSLEDA